MEDLEFLTLKILKSAETFTSNDFIKAYNIIYLHCTEKTPTYEIKGIVIYQVLKDILANYFDSLRPVTSLKGFFNLCQNLEKSYFLLERVYFYLERFFINVNCNKNESDIMHIRTLYYSLFYKKYFYASISTLEEYFFFELHALRESYYKKETYENINELCKTVCYLRNIYFYSENHEEYICFLDKYYNSFTQTSDVCEINKLVRKTNVELKIAKLLFDFSSKESYYEITKFIAKKFKRLLDWIFYDEQPDNLATNICKIPKFFGRFKKIENILHFMEDIYCTTFLLRIEPHLLQCLDNLKDLESIFGFYIEFRNTFISDSINIESLEDIFLKKIVEKIQDLENVPDFFARLIREISFETQNCESLINNIFILINKIEQKALIIKKLSHECLERIINDRTDLNKEMRIFRYCKFHCGSSGISWLNLILQAYGLPITENFGLGGQEFDFNTNLHLITKGFCNLEVMTCNLHPKLTNLCDILLKRFHVKYPRSDINCCYKASSLIIEIHNIDIKLSTDKVSLLMYLMDEPDLKVLKAVSKDSCFYENIDFLEKCGLIIVKDNYGYVNPNRNDVINKCLQIKENETYDLQNYRSDNTKYKSYRREGSNTFIDLFYYKIPEKNRIVNCKNNDLGLDYAVESFIMKLMKKLKIAKISFVESEVKKKFKFFTQFSDTIKHLVTKDFLDIKDDDVIYLP